MDGTTDKLEQAMRLAGRARHTLLAVVDETGTPRVLPVEQCSAAGGDRVAVQAWLDVPPLHDHEGRSRLALLFWDEEGHGYQLTGWIVRSREEAVLDGLAEIEERVRFPQTERAMLMQVDSVEEFHFVAIERPSAPR